MNGPSHDKSKFEEYIPYSGPEGEGFILATPKAKCKDEYLVVDEEVYIFDDFGGWVDERLNYYD